MLFNFFGLRLSPWIDIVVLLVVIFGGRAAIIRFDLTHWRRRLAILGLVVLFFILSPMATWVLLDIGLFAFLLYTQVAGVRLA